MNETDGAVGCGSPVKPKSPQRTFVDVIKKGGKRRGYITVRKRDDGYLEVGYSLCELKDRFSGTTGLNISFKRGTRFLDKSAYVLGDGNVGIGDGGSHMTTIPHTLLARLLNDAELAAEIFAQDGMITFPKWVVDLRNSSIVGRERNRNTH